MKKKGKKQKRAVIAHSSDDEEQEHDVQLQQKMDVEEMQNMDDDEEDVRTSNAGASVQILQTQSMPAPHNRAPPPPPRHLPKEKGAQKRATHIAAKSIAAKSIAAQSIAATPVGGRKAITERDLIQGAARLKTVKRNFNPGWLYFTFDRLYCSV